MSASRRKEFAQCADARASVRGKHGLSGLTYDDKMTAAEVANVRRYMQTVMRVRNVDAVLAHDVLQRLQDGVLCRFPRPSELNRLARLMGRRGGVTYYSGAVEVGLAGGQSGGIGEWADEVEREEEEERRRRPRSGTTASRSSTRSLSHNTAPGGRFAKLVGRQGANFARLTDDLGLLYLWLAPGTSRDTRELRVFATSSEVVRDAMDALGDEVARHGLELRGSVRTRAVRSAAEADRVLQTGGGLAKSGAKALSRKTIPE